MEQEATYQKNPHFTQINQNSTIISSPHSQNPMIYQKNNTITNPLDIPQSFRPINNYQNRIPHPQIRNFKSPIQNKLPFYSPTSIRNPVKQPILNRIPIGNSLNTRPFTTNRMALTPNASNRAPFMNSRIVTPGQHYIPSRYIQPSSNPNHYPRYHFLPPHFPQELSHDTVVVAEVNKQNGLSAIQSHITLIKQPEVEQKLNINYEIENEDIFCVVCQKNYLTQQFQKHIQTHKSRLDLSKIQPIKDLSQLDQVIKIPNTFNPQYRPIVEPEQCNVQYTSNSFIIEKNVEYRRKEDGEIVSYTQRAVGEQPIPIPNEAPVSSMVEISNSLNLNRTNLSPPANPYKSYITKIEPITERQFEEENQSNPRINSVGSISKKQITPSQIIKEVININLEGQTQLQNLNVTSQKPESMKRKLKESSTPIKKQPQFVMIQEQQPRFQRNTFNQNKSIPQRPITINQQKPQPQILNNKPLEVQKKQDEINFNQIIQQNSSHNQQPLPLSIQKKQQPSQQNQSIFNTPQSSQVQQIIPKQSRGDKQFKRQSQPLNNNINNLVQMAHESTNFKKKKIPKNTLGSWF